MSLESTGRTNPQLPSPPSRPPSTGGEESPSVERAPSWPVANGHDRVIFLLDIASGYEEGILCRWIEGARPPECGEDRVQILTIPSSRRSRGRVDPRLEPALATGEDPILAPLRVAWLPEERDGRRVARFSDIWKLGDPRDPNLLRARWVGLRFPDRWQIVAGEPAPASELRERWRRLSGTDSGATIGLADFVARQAALALERSERRLRGARYKVPRFVHDEVLSRPSLRGELSELARELGRPEARVTKEAARYLKEIAASHSPFVIDLVIQLWLWISSRSYDETLHHDPAQIEELRLLSQQHPLVFLPTHKSNLDHPVLQLLLHENGFPPNHTAGGINMNFFPIGPLVRRSGIFFIRRTFKDLPVYKIVLRHYIDYLIEKRFPLEWYIEGGRSRSGKLLPPRFGLLAYVVDAYRRGRSDDVILVPVSICYDQISDVGDYAAEQRGGAKQEESFGWFLRVLARLRSRYGKIFIRFGAPISLAKTLGPPDPAADPDPDEQNLALQKLAFETCVNINRSTPITPISLVCLALLGRGDRALSAEEAVGGLANLVDYVERRALETTEALNLRTPEAMTRILEELTASGLLVRFDAGPEAVYRIADHQHLAAAYYRNTVIHYFVTGAIAELALVRAADEQVEDRHRTFWNEAMGLRDLLKFEFFFPEKEAFREELRRELALHDTPGRGWEQSLERGPDAILEFLRQIRPLSAHRILRPFLEAYRVVADALRQLAPDAHIDENRFLGDCLALGTQYSLQQHVKRQESISKVLFGTALKLARNRDLVDPGAEHLEERRREFAQEIRTAIRGVDAVEVLVQARHAGLFD